MIRKFILSQLPQDSKWDPEIGKFSVYCYSLKELFSFELVVRGLSSNEYKICLSDQWLPLTEIPDFLYNGLNTAYCFTPGGREKFEYINFQSILNVVTKCDDVSSMRWKLQPITPSKLLFSLYEIRDCQHNGLMLNYHESWILPEQIDQ